MADSKRAEVKEDIADKQPSDKPGISVNDVDMKDFRPQDKGKIGATPIGFNHIETSTFDLAANKDGFVTADSLQKAAKNPNLDSVQKDDVKYMLSNFGFLRDQVKDGSKGISREDIAKYNFPHDINHIEDSTVAKLDKAADGTITKGAIADGLKRSDLSDIERDDMQYMQRQYANLKELSPSAAKKELGISISDIAASNARIGHYFAGQSSGGAGTGESNFVIIDRHNRQRQLDQLDKVDKKF